MASFDRAAPTYDADFTESQIGMWLRQLVWNRLAGYFQSGDFVLEIGCGTGEDARWLAQRGVRVLATDASPNMLRITAEKAKAAGLDDRVTCRPLDLNALPADFEGEFDGAFSNFGPLNCTAQIETVAQWLALRLKPGAIAAFGVMSRFCLWESLWHGLHLDFKTASRRWKGTSRAQLLDGSTFTVYYPTRQAIRAAFSPYFLPIEHVGIGLWLPPSDVFATVEKFPRIAQVLYWLEQKSAAAWPFRLFADHDWLVFRRV